MQNGSIRLNRRHLRRVSRLRPVLTINPWHFQAKDKSLSGKVMLLISRGIKSNLFTRWIKANLFRRGRRIDTKYNIWARGSPTLWWERRIISIIAFKGLKMRAITKLQKRCLKPRSIRCLKILPRKELFLFYSWMISRHKPSKGQLIHSWMR